MKKITRFRDIPQFTSKGIWAADYRPEELVRHIERETEELGLNMDPDFQRGHVWTEKQQRHWLEFFFRGGQGGRELYFNHPGWMRDWKGEYVIVDGKQRYEAFRKFIKNEIRIFGSYYKDFTDNIDCLTTMKVHVNNLQTRAAVLNWYLERNTGGTPHAKSEIAKVLRMLKQEISQ